MRHARRSRFALLLLVLGAWNCAYGAVPTFPLAVNAGGRYLQDQNGVPFRIHGDSGWEACTDLSLSELRTYLDDRKAKGFNTILVQITNPVRYYGISVAPAAKGAANALPFLKNKNGGTWDGDPLFANDMSAHNPAPGNFDADFSSPNNAYFAWIDTILSEAGSRGMLVQLTACYLGYNLGAQDGWWRTINNSVNTQAVCFGFGQYLGNRYKNVGNILWEAGVDMTPSVEAGATAEGTLRFHKLIEGVKAAGDTHLWIGHWKHDFLGTDDAAFAGIMDLEGVYTHGNYPTLGPTYGRSRLGYSRSPALPAVMVETNYEGEHGATPAQVREFMWGADLSCVGGVLFGNTPIWGFDTGWQTALNSTGSKDMQRLGGFLDALPWQQFVPSGLAGMKTLITAGGGTYTSLPNLGDGESGGDDWIVSSATPDGRYLIAYVPQAHSGAFSVDMTALSGTASGQWYDPTNASYTAVSGSPFANTGTRSFTTPGNNSSGDHDWALVLTATAGANTAPTVFTAASASPSPATGTTTALAVLGADDGGEAALTYTWATTGTPPATVTFTANGTNAAKATTATFTKAGSYTFQVTIRDAGGLTVASSVTVTVNQTLTAIAVAPPNATVTTGGTQAFSASGTDQFGAALAAQPTFAWTVSGGGTISAAGLFTAGGAAGGPFTVTAASGGKSGTAGVTVSNATITALNPVADTYALAGANAGNNFGTAANLICKSDPNLDFTRETFLRFDLSGISGTITGATLRLHPIEVDAAVTDAVGLVADDTWGETTLTWNNRPTAGADAATWTPTLNVAQDVDVTALAQGELAGDKKLSLRIRATGAVRVDYASRENADPTLRPTLILTIAGGSANAAPTVATAAAANPSPVTAISTALTVLGADDGGEAALTYTWATTGTPPAAVAFSANGSNAAKSTTATFSKAGSYTFQATIRDAGGLTATSSVSITVNQALTTITVAPPTAAMATGGTQAFTATAKDQFGQALSAQPAFAWTVSGGGTISPAGLFAAGSTAGGPFTVTAASGGKSGTASVTVTSTSLFAVKINFQPTMAPTVAGYLVDGGLAFANRGNGFSYGWSEDISDTARDRNAISDQLRDTLLQSQRPAHPNATWELAVPNGIYQVVMVCGDPSYTDSAYAMNLEGVLAVSGTPTAGNQFFTTVTGGVQVTVSDGRLTLSNATGSVNNKVCYIEVTQVPSGTN